MEKYHDRERVDVIARCRRKTANVITSVVDEQPNMAVDTHVFRVSVQGRVGHQCKTPYEVEKQLVRNIPEQYIHKAIIGLYCTEDIFVRLVIPDATNVELGVSVNLSTKT